MEKAVWTPLLDDPLERDLLNLVKDLDWGEASSPTSSGIEETIYWAVLRSGEIVDSVAGFRTEKERDEWIEKKRSHGKEG